jgi:hypothetical protein
MRSGWHCGGKDLSTGHNSVGLSLDAQPAQEAMAVRRSFFFMLSRSRE